MKLPKLFCCMLILIGLSCECPKENQKSDWIILRLVGYDVQKHSTLAFEDSSRRVWVIPTNHKNREPTLSIGDSIHATLITCDGGQRIEINTDRITRESRNYRRVDYQIRKIHKRN